MNIHALATCLVVVSILLSACGIRSEDNSSSTQSGGSGGDGDIFSPSASNPVGDLTLRVFSDVYSIPAGGSETARITVLVTDIDNIAVGGAEVTFNASSGVLQNVSSTTDDAGRASATLDVSKSYENTDLIIAISVNGGFDSSVNIVASGSTLDVMGPANVAAGDTAQLSIRLTAGNGEPIADQAISVTSVAGNSLSPADLTTDSDGQVDLFVGSENYSDTLLFTALEGTASANYNFDVVEELLTITNVDEGEELIVGDERIVTANWTRLGQAVVDEALKFSITLGSIVAPATIITDQDGNASILISSNSTGPSILAVEAGTAGAPQTETGIEFIATVPHRVAISASDSQVSIGETSTITAIVTDVLGNPVKNSEVSFTSADLNVGLLDPASAVTNSAGIASVTFTAGENATEFDEIQVTSHVEGTGAVDSMILSVAERAFNLAIGSGNEVVVESPGSEYALPLIVEVSDRSGIALDGVAVELSLRALAYGKGVLELVDEEGFNVEQVSATGNSFDAAKWAIASDFIECPAEDLDGDRVLDALEGVNEDTNSNGILDPLDSASLSSAEGDNSTLDGLTVQSDGNGLGVFELIYPASNASWAFVEVTASAEVLGDKATDTYTAYLAMPESVESEVNTMPANQVSPFGSDTTSSVVGQVVLNNRLMNVYSGCTTSL